MEVDGLAAHMEREHGVQAGQQQGVGDLHAAAGDIDGDAAVAEDGLGLADCSESNIQVLCPKCHKPYVFDHELRTKFGKLQKLIEVVREAEPILGDCCVSVNVPGGSVKVPYALLLTRLNTMLTLRVGGKSIDFHLWIQPSSPDTFR